MEFDLRETVKELDGREAIDAGHPIAVKDALLRALFSDVNEDGQLLKPDDKIARYALVMKIYGNDTVDLTQDEVNHLKSVVLIYPTMLAGQIRTYLSKTPDA